MAVRTTTEPATVVRWCTEAAELDPVRNNIFSTVAAYVAWHPEPGVWAARRGTARAARSGAGSPLVVTDGWADAGELAALVRGIGDVAGVEGPVGLVDAVSGQLPWPGRRLAERLYRCDELHAPRDVGGEARLATDADVELLARWHVDFVREAVGTVPAHFDAHRHVERSLQTARPWIWEDGEPRSCATGWEPVSGVARIGRVYTPSHHRGRGYGSAVTAAAARDIIDAGGLPILYTDLGNPTSNKIYQALGFRPVLDWLALNFG